MRGWISYWPLCWRSDLDEMRLRLVASHQARQQAEEALLSAMNELHRYKMIVAEQAEALRATVARGDAPFHARHEAGLRGQR